MQRDMSGRSIDPLRVNANQFLGEGIKLQRIENSLELQLTPHTYTPKLDPREDWVASVAVPAFRAFRDKNLDWNGNFATIGTGIGLDALAAIEILNPKLVMLTDLHTDVIRTATKNVYNHMLDSTVTKLVTGRGELSAPLIFSGRKFDIVYENLPNIPLPENSDINDGMASSSFARGVPNEGAAGQYLLGLHAQFLKDSASFLNPEGHVLSSIGGRIPLEAILTMAQEAGCESSILSYTWKIQSEVPEVVNGYAEWEAKGKGPFHFFRHEDVERVFEKYSSSALAAQNAFGIEQELAMSKITATEALKLLDQNVKLAHTAVVIESYPKY